MFDFNSKIAQTKQNISKFVVGKSSLQLNGKCRLISGRFHTLIWRPGDTVQTLESPGALCNVWSLPLWQQQAQHKPGKSKNSTDNFTVTFKMSTNTISCPEKEQKNIWEKYVECPGKVE